MISGEVLYPGEYLITKDDRLADIIIRAGGFTNNAFLKGALFTRDKVKRTTNCKIKRIRVSN